MNWNIWRFYHYRIPLEFNYFPTTPFEHDQVKQPYVVYVFQIVLKLSSVHIYFIFFFFRNYYMSITFWLLILWFLEGRKSKQGKYICFFSPFFPSLNMIHICKDYLCLLFSQEWKMFMLLCAILFFLLISFCFEYET